MSRGSTVRRQAERSRGLPSSWKDKAKLAMFTLTKIALGDRNPQVTAMNALSILGIKRLNNLEETSGTTEQQG